VFRQLDRPAGRSGILVRWMALLDPRLLEIEILSEAERKTFAGGDLLGAERSRNRLSISRLHASQVT
jgi:hypothetical protein